MLGYYYCSLSTFLNIIKNKQVYLSDPLKMNDSLEIKWYDEISFTFRFYFWRIYGKIRF